MRKVIIVAGLILFMVIGRSHGQEKKFYDAPLVGVKTNALYWLATTINVGAEIGLGRKTTVDLLGTYNPWSFGDNKKVKHWLIQPEFRYWTCERFNGHFFGLHSGYGEYNISGVRIPFLKKSVKDHRYQGWATGLGISYGYSWLLGRRWNLEATVGAGYVYTNYDRYECATCGKFRGTGDRHYFGPTKAGISIIYIID